MISGLTRAVALSFQLRNHNRVKAPTAERAASLLDSAVAARRHSDFITYLSDSSIMFFTLHIQPPRAESSTIGKGRGPPLRDAALILRLGWKLSGFCLKSAGSRGPTKLTMIDVCSGIRGMSRKKLPYSELGPIVVSLLSGSRTIPNK